MTKILDIIKQKWRRFQSFLTVEISSKIHYRYIKRFHQLKNSDRLIDIGCGRGDFLKKLTNISRHHVGVDIDRDYIGKTDIPLFVVANAETLCFKDSAFDIIFSSHAIEHISDIGSTFREFARILRPNGKIILIYPWEPILGVTIITNMSRFRNIHKTHKQIFNPNKIRKILGNNGLRHVGSKLYYALSPMYMTCLAKE